MDNKNVSFSRARCTSFCRHRRPSEIRCLLRPRSRPIRPPPRSQPENRLKQVRTGLNFN